jgi:3-hydroxyacyl-CoA dehydrogenase
MMSEDARACLQPGISEQASNQRNTRGMALDRAVRRVAIVGAGAVGASWAAFYLARGFDVIAADPQPGAEANLRQAIDAAWPALKALGISPKGSPEHLSFTPNVAAAVSEVDFIQECGPEDQEQKIGLFAEIDRFARADAIVASSSAGLAITTIQSACGHPERCVTAHSMDPPHLMPLVEIAAGEKTSPQAVRRALSFYASVGKRPIFVRRELPGLAASRLSAALHREIDLLVAQGVLESADADTAVRWGPGLRWVLAGAGAMLPGNHSTERFAREHEAALVALLRLRSKSTARAKASAKSGRRGNT